MFDSIYADKKVLITGHTGFKGSWLVAWLLKLGARVAGLSKEIPTTPSNFEILGLESRLNHHIADIRDPAAVRRIVDAERPDFVFHLAAQAIVSRAHAAPLETLATNALGTAHLLDALRGVDWPCCAILITSDKCYENVEWPWGYRENDRLGGKDIYSASKGAAELIVHAYFCSWFAQGETGTRLATARAGNVIGGGDWAPDRIIPDCVRAWSADRPVEIRNPAATRPWQHVLEPLSGYLALGQRLRQEASLHGQSFNFGPAGEQSRTVEQVLRDLATRWGFKSPQQAYRVVAAQRFHEAGLLKLNCDKALHLLQWQPTLDYAEMIDWVGEWHRRYHQKEGEMERFTLQQIDAYEQRARVRGALWAQL